MPTQDATFDTLSLLIETCKDGEYGLRTSAEVLQGDEFKAQLRQRAAEFRNAAAALQSHLHLLGGPAEGADRAISAIRLGGVTVNGALPGTTDEAILDDVEHGERAALQRFRWALSERLTPAARSLVEEQLDDVKDSQAQFRKLRDRSRAAQD